MNEYDEDEFIKVADPEDRDEIIELPVEKNGTVLLSTLQAQFPIAVGLRYKSSSGSWRGIRCENNILDPPSSGWGETTYQITQDATKKKGVSDNIGDMGTSSTSNDTSNADDRYMKDIVVFGLPYSTTEEELREYFTEKCGELAYYEIKKDFETKKSRGFAFIRFVTEESQNKALNMEHEIEGKQLTVMMSKKKEKDLKLFVGRLRSGTSKSDVNEYFGKYGTLTDVFVPEPFRGFGFVTYESESVGMKVSRMHHTIKGANLNVTVANPIEENRGPRMSNYGDYKIDNRFNHDHHHSDRSRDRSGDRTHDDRSYRQSSRYDDRRHEGSSASTRDKNDDLKHLLVALMNKK